MSYWNKREHSAQETETPKKQVPKKTESFFSRNVRTITFLICITLFLIAFVPIAVLEAYDYLSKLGDVRPDMTLIDVIALSDRDGAISVSQISGFSGTESKGDDTTYYYFDIEPYYTVLAVADNDTKMLLYCQLANLETGETVDVLKEDVRAFLEEN